MVIVIISSSLFVALKDFSGKSRQQHQELDNFVAGSFEFEGVVATGFGTSFLTVENN